MPLSIFYWKKVNYFLQNKNAEECLGNIEKKHRFSIDNKNKIHLGDTRIWTKDLSICSRMLYHWAISPCTKTM